MYSSNKEPVKQKQGPPAVSTGQIGVRSEPASESNSGIASDLVTISVVLDTLPVFEGIQTFSNLADKIDKVGTLLAAITA